MNKRMPYMQSDILKSYIKNNKLITSTYYDEFDLRKTNDCYLFTMTDYNWNYYIGEGKTINDSIKNASKVMSCYDKNFESKHNAIMMLEPVYLEEYIMPKTKWIICPINKRPVEVTYEKINGFDDGDYYVTDNLTFGWRVFKEELYDSEKDLLESI